MKFSSFPLRLINLLVILALIGVYQAVALDRADKEAAALAKAQAEAAEQRADSGAESVYKDGTYTGSAQGYGGAITVEVTIKDGMITEITPVSHSGEDASYWSMASDMIPRILETQNPNVDTVSGATLSSTGIHNAVTKALKSALK